MIIGVFVILGWSLYTVSRQSTSKANTDRAWDMIKIIAGFFIGNLAGVFK